MVERNPAFSCMIGFSVDRRRSGSGIQSSATLADVFKPEQTVAHPRVSFAIACEQRFTGLTATTPCPCNTCRVQCRAACADAARRRQTWNQTEAS
ncbi:hypothetical protein BCEP27_30297 [Burkholderia cepacia]